MSHPTDRLVSIETQQQILEQLSFDELRVVSLRLDGHNQVAIAMLLGLSRSAVCHRLSSAQRKILDRFPELEPWAEDRHHRRGTYHLIDRSWTP